jgi:hypothetical protein
MAKRLLMKWFLCVALAVSTSGMAAANGPELMADQGDGNAAITPQEVVAADEVKSANIKEADGTTGQNTNTGSGIKTAHIQDYAVTAPKIAAGVITTNKIRDNAVTDAKITGPITGSKISGDISVGNIGADNITLRQGYNRSLTFSDGTVQKTAVSPASSTGWVTITGWAKSAGSGIQFWPDGNTLDAPIGKNGWVPLEESEAGNAGILVYVDDGQGVQQLPCKRSVSGAGKTGIIEFRYMFDYNVGFAIWLNPMVDLESGAWDSTYMINTYLPSLKWRAVIIPAN